MLPVIGILALEQRLSSEAVATLLGTVVGYVLSGIGKDERRKPVETRNEAEAAKQ